MILSDLGLVVEGVEVVGESLDDVIVARVDEIRAIKGADRVRLVVVDAGQGPLEIVCGAMNFEVGNYVPLAPVGAVLPGGFEIARAHDARRDVARHALLLTRTALERRPPGPHDSRRPHRAARRRTTPRRARYHARRDLRYLGRGQSTRRLVGGGCRARPRGAPQTAASRAGPGDTERARDQ